MNVKVKNLKVGDAVLFYHRQINGDGIHGSVRLKEIKEEGKNRLLIFDHGDIRLSKESEVNKLEGFEKFQKKRKKRKYDGKRV